MTKLPTKLKTSKLSGISFLSVILVLGTVAPAFAANLNINDSVENQITLSHDGNWEFGVTSNGVAFGPFVGGFTVAPGESASFSGTWLVNSGGSPDPGSGIIYVLDPNTGQVSDIITANWSTIVFPGFDIATINVSVTSSAKCSDLGALPAGFTGVVETGASMAIQGSFVDPGTGAAVSIPSNLTMQFESGEECEIDAEKTWTHTDYNWDQICDISLGVPGFVNPADGLCYSEDTFVNDIGFRPANINNVEDDVLADPLPFDGEKYTAFAQLHKEKFKNTNPGAFYALTTIDVNEDLDNIWVEEIYSDCTVAEDLLKFVSKKETRNVKVAVADSSGDVTELTDLLYDIGSGTATTADDAILADINSADVHIEGALATEHLTEGSTVYVLVKFQDDLKNEDAAGNQFDEMCDNTENVTSDIGGDQNIIVADASLRITNDSDGDGVNNNVDNCPFVANPGQVDVDGDGAGAACDIDDNDDQVQ